MNFHLPYGTGRLCNQLFLLYHIYESYEIIDHIYAPTFNDQNYRIYFNIDDKDILCDLNFFTSNFDSFKTIKWEGQNLQPIGDIYNPKFSDLKLKKSFNEKVENLVHMIGKGPLVSVHIRHGDFKRWGGGKYFFPIDHYLKIAYQKIKDWDLHDYKILFFSDSILPPMNEGIVVSKLTDNLHVIDLFLMAHCNYFIHTVSTFSLLAIQLSQGLKKFKDSQLV